MRNMLRGALAAIVFCIAMAPAGAMSTNIQSYICSKLDDFSATMSVVSVNERALSKISKDAVMLYRFKDMNMRYKEPNKVRMEGSQNGTRAIVIMNGSVQTFSLPKSRLVKRSDFGSSPGKRKSLMDVGIVSEYYLTYTNAKYLREGTVEGVHCAVFEMSYKDRSEDTSHHIVYIDPQTRVVLKREAYSQEGKFQAIYLYKDIKEVANGIWFPTRVEVQNTDRVIAAVSAYKEIKVNVGIPDNIFKL